MYTFRGRILVKLYLIEVVSEMYFEPDDKFFRLVVFKSSTRSKVYQVLFQR